MITVLVIVVLFVAGAAFLLWPQFHHAQQGLSRPVEAKVTDVHITRNRGLGSIGDYRVTYTYAVDGHTFEGNSVVVDGTWSEQKPLPLCVDPSQPERHAALIKPGAACGDKDLHNTTRTAKRID